MSSQQLDEEAIFEVACEIQNPVIRGKYLSQVCHDERLLGRLEGRLMSARRRWQFSLRAFLAAMLIVGCLLAVAVGFHTAARERQRASDAQQMALQARNEAERQRAIAAQTAAQAAANFQQAEQQLKRLETARPNDVAASEGTTQ
jgi:Tfp pilus assembly protein PilE